MADRTFDRGVGTFHVPLLMNWPFCFLESRLLPCQGVRAIRERRNGSEEAPKLTTSKLS